ncbi:hypothetical protein [Psychroserpens luteolus]|uniref:hypothetical protein n=1 Tax=Psychroserpens luteolus TaxID=2855840 RepID=UPI001E40C49C|nr:hypothetical protein [Psychroserpens luteolus]MCD2259054.1 hypothetical protein [Psychroserpens luteolus]
MGGYMGFGMAKWIYTQRPQKAFSKKKSKPTCNTLPTYSRQFKLQPSKQTGHFYIVISLILLGLLLSGFYFRAPDFVEHSNKMSAQKQAYNQSRDNEAFQFLVSSGTKRLKGNNLQGAYSEFKLAYTIDPENEHLYQLLVETLSTLCKDGNTYCDDLDTILSHSL